MPRQDITEEAVIRALVASLRAIGQDVPVLQAYQAERHGTPGGQHVTIHKLYQRIVGHPHIGYDTLNIGTSAVQIYEYEEQLVEAAYQVNASSGDAGQQAANELCENARRVLQRRTSVRELVGKGIALLRVTDMRNDYWVDDKSRHDSAPSFDVILQYHRILPPVNIGAANSHKVTFNRI